MRQRAKKLIVYLLVVMLVCHLFGMDKLVSLAAEIIVETNVTVTTDDNNDYIYGSGGEKTLTVSAGATLSGKIDFTNAEIDGSENALINNGTITGNIITGNVLAYIENNGTISSASFNLAANSRLSNTGTIGNITLIGGELEVTGGTINSITDSGTSAISLSSCSIGTLSTTSPVAVSNSVIVDSLMVGAIEPSGNATVEVSDYLKSTNGIGATQVIVGQNTVIDTTGGSGYSVYYNDKEYAIDAEKKGSLLDFYGKKLIISIPSDCQVTLSGGSETVTYMPGDVSSTYTIKPLEGYYFPEGYEVGITTDGAGVLKATRVNDQEVTISYTISANESGDVTISVPVAIKKPKEPGTGSITVEDIYYGATVNAVVDSRTNDVSTAKIEYKEKDAANSSYSTNKPKKVGAYTARVTFAENDSYTAFTATTNFNISFLPVPNNPYILSGVKGENDFYISDVTITPLEGYSVSDTLDGKYKSTLVVKSSTQASKLYFINDETGEKTSGKKLPSIKIDKTLPAIGAEDKQIYYGDTVTVKVSDKNLSKVFVNESNITFDDNQVNLTLQSDNGLSEYQIKAVDLAGNSCLVRVSVAAKWMETGIIPLNEVVRLSLNQAYRLESGKWSVNGDSTKYSGGQRFYVRTEGEYTFTKE